LRVRSRPRKEEQPAGHQEKVHPGGLVTLDHWEDDLEGTAGDTQEGRAGSGDESPSKQGEETEFEF
jgi:hypothetical protein